MELSIKEEKHKEVMEALAKICRSNKRGFIEGKTDKIDAIRDLMKDSGYHEILLPNAQIWRKDFSTPIDVVVSSHADVVDSITKCSSKLKEKDEGVYYSGTYDNAGTNAALVISALEGNLPDNTVIAFTADEESGRCSGAKQVLEYARNSGYEPVCIALDVTYEGFDEGYLFTVENASSGHKKEEDMSFLNDLANAMIAVDPEDDQGCCFVKLSKNGIPDEMDRKYLAKGSSWLDEAQIYGREHAKTFSLCLPCDGEMHDNRGVDVKQPTFEGYVNALEYMIYAMSKSPNLQQILEEKKAENSILLGKAKEMAKKEEESSKSKYADSYYAYKNGLLSEDDYYDYLAYNESYRVNGYDNSNYNFEYRHNAISDKDYVESWYDEEVFPTFKSYVDSVIEDIVEVVYEYSEEERESFIEEAISYMPDDVIEWFGGLDRAVAVVKDVFDSVYGTCDLDFENPNKEEDYSFDEDDFSEEKMDEEDTEYEEDDYSGYYDEM